MADIQMAWVTVYFVIGLALYLPIIVIVYFHAENCGESGVLWAGISACLPIIGPIIYIIWSILKFIGNKKLGRRGVRVFMSPGVAPSRQRLNGGDSPTQGGRYPELDVLINRKQWDNAEKLQAEILEAAEEARDHKTIADMITCKEMIKRGRRNR